MRTLEPYWRKAIADGRPVRITSDAGARFFLGRLGTEELLKLERSRGVDLELLRRKGVRDEVRREALADLARRDRKEETATLLGVIRGIDGQEGDRDESVVFDLARLLAVRGQAQLAGVRGDLEGLASGAHTPVVCQLGFLAAHDRRPTAAPPTRAWDLATKSVSSLRDLLDAMPMIADPSVRAGLYPKVAPLLQGLPKSLAGPSTVTKGTLGRFVRIELMGRRTLTLAEVEVFSATLATSR